MSTKWIDTIKSCVTQQAEQRRGLLRKIFLNADYSSYSPSRALEFSRILNSIGTDILVLQEIFEEIIHSKKWL